MRNNSRFLGLFLVFSFSVAYADSDICQTQVILLNKLTNPMYSSAKLTVNLEKQGKINWKPVWNQIEFSSTQTTMIYPKQVGAAPQSNALFTVHDRNGGLCSFSPWIIANCDVVFSWNCTANTQFTPQFTHLKRVAQMGPWIIELVNRDIASR